MRLGPDNSNGGDGSDLIKELALQLNKLPIAKEDTFESSLSPCRYFPFSGNQQSSFRLLDIRG